jgi:hypothetical protein
MMSEASGTPSPRTGLGFAGWCAVIAAILASACLVQIVEVVFAIDAASEMALPVPGLAVLLVLLGVNALGLWLLRARLLTRAQVAAVAFGIILSAPLATQGFWHRIHGLVSTMPREGQFWLMDGLSDKLWPHGADLVAGATPPRGGTPIALAAGRPLELPLAGVTAGNPFLISVLARCEAPPAGLNWRAELVHGDRSVEAWRLDRATRPDAIRGDGYERIGVYGLRAPEANGPAALRFTLEGPGTVELLDAKVVSVAALELSLRGREPVTASRYAAMTPAEQGRAVVVPDGWMSAAGMAFTGGGGVPWSEWIVPLCAWGAFLVLMLTGIFAIGLLMRPQWAEAERLPYPLARGVGLLTGLDGERPLWRSTWFWTALLLAGLWCQLKYWHGHVSTLPDATIAIPLKAYVTDPGLQKMWDVTFTVSAIFLGLALFFELNLLASLVVGFFLYRSLFWLGETTGLGTEPGYPWRFEQQIGAYVAYAMAIVWLARRHLASVAHRAFTGGWRPAPAEVVAPRTALLLLLGSCALALVWAAWVGFSLGGFSLFFIYLLLVGVVSARLRAECGLLFGYFTPYNATLALAAAGGMATLGPELILFATLASAFLATCTFHAPGAQLEFIEVGRKEGLNGRSLAILPIVAIVVGMVVAGWAFLTLSYGRGGDTLHYSYPYDTKLWYFSAFNQEVNSLKGGNAGGGASLVGMAIGGSVTLVVAGLRQLFAGFWLHPAGLVLAPSYLTDMIWGSCLVALALRSLTVRLAGAVAVRERLLPAGLGIFLGGCLAYAVAAIHGAVLIGGSGFTRLIEGIP